MHLIKWLPVLVASSYAARFVVPTISDFQQNPASVGRTEVLESVGIASLTYQEYNLSVPVDHFHNDSLYEPHSDDHFNLRYWFDASHYQSGGPVLVFAAGEVTGTYRWPLLEKGMIARLAAALNGIGVILEHRYYGKSFPVPDLSTPNFRFLTTDQAMADTAYFARNIVFPGLENENLTAPTTPWIVYGVSYSGAFAAFLRKLYPDVFWGAISSSGVTEAIIDFWQYFEPVRKYGPADCIHTTQVLTNVADKILIDSGNVTLTAKLKSVFGLSDVRDDHDFANILSVGISAWQSRQWDPKIASAGIMYYCNNITSSSPLYPSISSSNATVTELLEAAGYGDNSTLVTRMLNWIGFVNTTTTTSLLDENENLIQSRVATPATANSSGVTFQPGNDIADNAYKAWYYQVCTQWGYFTTGSGFPESLGLPLISRLIDMPYSNSFCRDWFNITAEPNITAINKYGGFEISYPRLAIIDGLLDPWRDATPHADVAPPRESTDSEPFLLIDIDAEDVWDGIRGGVHHWETNGVHPNETAPRIPPAAVVDTQEAVLAFTATWMEDWTAERMSRGLEQGQERSQRGMAGVDLLVRGNGQRVVA